ncbi:MAG: nucleotidyltransferase [Candidatus Margulisbacteria bacterium]|nr:nucleotidyltransferase [Candidatus Margulisiibacteriota bacterium]
MDIENLLKLLKEHKVKFVIIGAMAFPAYGYSRVTLDTDIFIEPTEKNAENTWKALKRFGYDIADITINDLLTKKLLIRQYLVETDIHPFVTGATFEEVWKHKKTGKIGTISVYFASLNDLIKMKKAAGRKKDKEDLKILKMLHEQ